MGDEQVAIAFGQRIRELRRAKGISLRNLADRIGRDFTYLSKIETGKCLPPAADVIVALAAHLDTDAEELATLGNKPSVATLRARLAESEARVRELDEIAAGMAACVEALDTNQAWYSRSRIALTLRDSLRAWSDKYAALRGAEGTDDDTTTD